jgi:VanZ family protein
LGVTALRLLPPLAWTLLVAWLSTAAGSGQLTVVALLALVRLVLPGVELGDVEALHSFIRKAAHLVEYAVLAGLWRWALVPMGLAPAWWGALALSMFTAGLDEWHQAATPGRTGSVMDIVLDTAGALSALAVSGPGAGRVVDRFTDALLWLGALCGTAFALLDWAAAAPWSWLWWSAPLAWICLGARLYSRRG